MGTINIKKIRPMFNAVVTTFDVYEDTNTKTAVVGTDAVAGQPKPYQTVVAVGPTATGINVGDVVAVDFSRYARTQHKDGSLKDGVIQDNPVVSYAFNTIQLNGKEHLFLHSNDILFVIEDFDENVTEIITTAQEVVS